MEGRGGGVKTFTVVHKMLRYFLICYKLSNNKIIELFEITSS